MITYKHRLPWVTKNVRKLINKKNKAYNKRKTNPTKYKTLKHQVQKELRKADYIEKIICDLSIREPDQHIPSKVKPKNLFSYIKSIRTDNSGVAPLKRDGIIVTDTVEKADILNNQVQSVFTNETDTDIPDKDHSPHSKMPQINISSAGVSKRLCNLNPHKSCGPDNIHGRILKELNEQVAPILTSIFSKSLKSGEISKRLETCKRSASI